MSNDSELISPRREEMEDFDEYWGNYGPGATKRADPPIILRTGMPMQGCGYDDLVRSASPGCERLDVSVPDHEGGIVDIPTSYDANGEPHTHVRDLQHFVESHAMQPDVVCAPPSNGTANRLRYAILALVCLLCVLLVAAVRVEKTPPDTGGASKSFGVFDRNSPAVTQLPSGPQSEPPTLGSEQASISETLPTEAHLPRKSSVLPVRPWRQFIPPPSDPLPSADNQEAQDIGPPPIDIPLDLAEPSKIEALRDVDNVPAAEDQSIRSGTHRGKLKTIFTGLSRVFSGRKQKVSPEPKAVKEVTMLKTEK